MSKPIFLVVGVLVVVAGVLAYVMKSAPSGEEAPGEAAAPATEESSEAGPRSLVELLSSTEPQRCSFTRQEANSYSEGTVYVEGGMMRGDFTSTASGQTFSSHLIVKDGMTYTWMDDIGTGFKAAVSESATAPTEEGVDINQKLDYRCEPSPAEESFFTLPEGITFIDAASLTPTSR